MSASPKALQTQQAHAALLEQLHSGALQGGEFLSMPALCERLDMPLSAVREAVKRAEATGLLSVLPKRGVQIMETGPQTTFECLDLRAVLDCEGVRRLLQSDRELPLAALREAHENLLNAAKAAPNPSQTKLAIETDRSLHTLMSEGLGDGLMRQLYLENHDRIAILQNAKPFLPTRIVSAMEEHLAIIDALEKRDIAAAQAAIREHLSQTLLWWGVVETA